MYGKISTSMYPSSVYSANHSDYGLCVLCENNVLDCTCTEVFHKKGLNIFSVSKNKKKIFYFCLHRYKECSV